MFIRGRIGMCVHIIVSCRIVSRIILSIVIRMGVFMRVCITWWMCVRAYAWYPECIRQARHKLAL